MRTAMFFAADARTPRLHGDAWWSSSLSPALPHVRTQHHGLGETLSRWTSTVSRLGALSAQAVLSVEAIETSIATHEPSRQPAGTELLADIRANASLKYGRGWSAHSPALSGAIDS